LRAAWYGCRCLCPPRVLIRYEGGHHYSVYICLCVSGHESQKWIARVIGLRAGLGGLGNRSYSGGTRVPPSAAPACFGACEAANRPERETVAHIRPKAQARGTLMRGAYGNHQLIECGDRRLDQRERPALDVRACVRACVHCVRACERSAACTRCVCARACARNHGPRYAYGVHGYSFRNGYARAAGRKWPDVDALQTLANAEAP
jgi:hypothetical protein